MSCVSLAYYRSSIYNLQVCYNHTQYRTMYPPWQAYAVLVVPCIYTQLLRWYMFSNVYIVNAPSSYMHMHAHEHMQTYTCTHTHIQPCMHLHMHNYFCNYADSQLVVNQHRNKLGEKCLGSHWGSNPRPPTLAVGTLTTELRLTLQYPSTL